MNYSLLPSYVLTGMFAAGFIYKGITLIVIPGIRNLFTSK